MMDAYADFLARKAQLGSMSGFEPVFMPDFLFDFQASLTAIMPFANAGL